VLKLLQNRSAASNVGIVNLVKFCIGTPIRVRKEGYLSCAEQLFQVIEGVGCLFFVAKDMDDFSFADLQGYGRCNGIKRTSATNQWSDITRLELRPMIDPRKNPWIVDVALEQLRCGHERSAL
jgi:hypothetical protein